MSLCPACGLNVTDGELCFHHFIGDQDWPLVNRVMCNLIHRQKEPERLPPDERFDASIIEEA